MSDTNYQFSRFGTKMLTIAILSIISFILGIIGIFAPVVGIINWIIQIVILSILISATKHALEANGVLNNKDLGNFCRRIKTAAILTIIGLPFFFIAMILFQTNAWPAGIPLVIVGVILLLIAAIKRILGWSDLKGFFRDNKAMFPEDIGKKGETGGLLLMIGAIFYLTIILMFIGFILDVIGYFMLSSLKDLGGEPAPKPVAQPAPAKAPAEPAKTDVKRFCPNCGSPVEGSEKYCGSCGSEL
ncbi:MAG: zinc-ribbon domain-containing protein [Candidatus Hodarchaeota archaeon]